jgi:hypothetical protein
MRIRMCEDEEWWLSGLGEEKVKKMGRHEGYVWRMEWKWEISRG